MMTPRLQRAIEALLNDIDAMRYPRGGFGAFGVLRYRYVDGDATAIIEWPNLDISSDELRLALAEELKNAE